jgi:retron-type reverse transcriptase
LPTGRKTYGNGSGIVVRLHNEVQKRFYSSKRNAVQFYGVPSLEHLLVYDDEEKCINAYECITKKEVLLAALERSEEMKAVPGNMTRGTDSETFDGISNSFFDRLVEELESEKFQCQPIRRTFISKSKGKFRPIGISSPRDKIIQEAMKILLETIFEPKFSKHSHSFRPGRGCHTALAEIRF